MYIIADAVPSQDILRTGSGAPANALNIPRPHVFATVAEERLHRKRMLVAAFRLFSRFWIRRSGGGTHHLTRSGQTVAEFINQVYDYAGDLASSVSPRSLVVIKRQVYESMFQPLQEGFDASERKMLASLDSLDFKEGVDHYLEKRSLAFVGR